MIFLGLIVIRYLFHINIFYINHAFILFNIASLAKPTKANGDFAKGMTFYPISMLNYLLKLANSQR